MATTDLDLDLDLGDGLTPAVDEASMGSCKVDDGVREDEEDEELTFVALAPV